MEVTLLVNTTIAGLQYAAGAKVSVSEVVLKELIRLGACVAPEVREAEKGEVSEPAPQAKSKSKSVFQRNR